MAGPPLDHLFTSERPKLLRFLRRLGQVDAEDIVQQAFLRLCTIEPGHIEEPRGYLRRMVANLAISQMRRTRRSPVVTIDTAVIELVGLADEGLKSDDLLIAQERIAGANAAFRALPEKERLAVILCKLEGKTHAQAAARLGVSPRTIEDYLARAIAKCNAGARAD